jgi:hypothetical protein
MRLFGALLLLEATAAAQTRPRRLFAARVGIDRQIQDDTDQASFLWTETGQP